MAYSYHTVDVTVEDSQHCKVYQAVCRSCTKKSLTGNGPDGLADVKLWIAAHERATTDA